jgi:hypothetical protein
MDTDTIDSIAENVVRRINDGFNLDNRDFLAKVRQFVVEEITVVTKSLEPVHYSDDDDDEPVVAPAKVAPAPPQPQPALVGAGKARRKGPSFSKFVKEESAKMEGVYFGRGARMVELGKRWAQLTDAQKEKYQ